VVLVFGFVGKCLCRKMRQKMARSAPANENVAVIFCIKLSLEALLQHHFFNGTKEK
jgi:hypothetical protein